MALGDGRKVILALDTSSDMLVCGVAAWDENVKKPHVAIQMLSKQDHMCRRQANVELVSTAQQALAAAGLTMAKVDSILVGRGPGSFTGVRIGIATAKGLACGAGIPLWGGSTLDGIAWAAWRFGVRGMLGVVADAMRGEVYPGTYQLDDAGAHRLFGTEVVRKADVCIEHLRELAYANELMLCGDGLVKHRSKFEEAGFTNILDEALWRPTSEGLLLAYIAPNAVPDRAAGDPALVLPVYTRLSDAEENERKRLGMQVPAHVALTGTADALADVHLQLRPMSINDVDQVAALEEACFAHSVHKPWTRTMFEEELCASGRSWWIAHDRGQIIGVAGGMLVGDDMEIATVDVAPNRRREKIASRLIARLAYDAHMLNAQSISLEVYEHNNAALALYKHLGFVQEGTRPHYYGPGNAAYIMRATLPLSVDVQAGEVAPEPQASIRPWPVVAGERSAQTQQMLAQAGDLILSIESSCDETAMAIIDAQGQICANVVATSIDFHARFGGVVPEIASRKHVEAIVGVFEEVMAQAGEHFGCDTLEPADLSAVGVTAGPGLVGALVVGVAFAKGLCVGANLPLIAAHHLEGHLLANLFETPDLKPPFVASLVSGGNTMLVHVRAWGDYEILGTTIDDAVGEAFDKVAKALGLGYPGGPIISKLAAHGNKKAIHFPRAMMHSHDYRFSLSGLKTSVITYIENQNKAGISINLPDLAASFEAAVIDVQVAKAIAAVEQTGVSDFCVGGGVAANPSLRAEYQRKFGKRGVHVTVPPLAVCGDNGAMIAAVALRNFRAQQFAELTLDADPNAVLGTWSSLVEPVVSAWEH
ncbi:tRNA (adenosine(37)-N6)-threonylcarbamoyltransferase complex transferase subunit TsaD [Atopobium fossor]|uniref:tRNA (adenosine(37)-N6)-threonylcarbamoyltransferase complex transferase subunit TsaD n=1 Tax=Atopobium fossor TaxID=39487 RepID=UPI000422DC83|nr:tRNA (adenosine(37)-N6)-threonylcarbamoyltransferase complex transferase subunit TsaD [Atopobium fossor]